MKLRKIYTTLLICGFIMVSVSGCSGKTVVIEQLPESTEEAKKSEENEDPITVQVTVPAAEKIKVYVCGAVQKPGVYELDEESRLCDAIDQAGGFTADADQTGLNLAQKLTDEEYIRVLTIEEASEMSGAAEIAVTADAGGSQNGKININTASREQLMTLPGIGESKADAILAYRQECGAFSSVEQIMEISGIKNSVFNKIRDLITV